MSKLVKNWSLWVKNCQKFGFNVKIGQNLVFKGQELSKIWFFEVEILVQGQNLSKLWLVKAIICQQFGS